MHSLHNMDNMKFNEDLEVELIYCDYVYEDKNFCWADKYYNYMIDGGIFICQTDFHSCPDIWKHMESLGAKLISHSVWKNEWGNHPKRTFHQCFDDILIFTNNLEKYNFYPEKIQVPKATAKTALNPSGRQTKTATAWIDDVCLTTTSKERVKKNDGHLVRWQKPLKLFDRIISPFIGIWDIILDPFMGSGSLGKWCEINNVDYIGIEKDKDIFKLAVKNIEGEEEV